MNPTSHPPTALVLDDEPAMAEILGDMCEAVGYRPTVVHSASALFALADATTRFDVLILDLSLPDIDGVEVLRRLQDEGPSVGAVVLVSGHNSSVLEAARRIAQAREFRVLGTLGKPIRAAALGDLLAAQAGPARPPPRQRAAVHRDELEQAIIEDRLTVHVQPQVALASGAWVGMEALVRWPREGELLLPDMFVPLAEDSGLALAMTRSIARKAMLIAREAHERLGFAGTLSVNLAPVSLTDLRFPDDMAQLAQQIGWDPKRLWFEVTETSVPRDPLQELDILTRLRLKGFNLSIDDFGTGHSSMENLQCLPISELKIDMSFIRPAFSDRTARMIAEKSIALGRELDLLVIAEGVESVEHWHWLNGLGCEEAQGYFVSRPIPGDQLANWYREWCLRLAALRA